MSNPSTRLSLGGDVFHQRVQGAGKRLLAGSMANPLSAWQLAAGSAQYAVDFAQRSIPPLETLVAVSRHRLAVLIGSQASVAAALQPWDGTVKVPAVQSGQPAALLERRPDVLALRAQLEAARRRQQARTEWFPRLFLSALFGSENLEVNGIDLGSARCMNPLNHRRLCLHNTNYRGCG